MKRFICLALALTLCLALCACTPKLSGPVKTSKLGTRDITCGSFHILRMTGTP